MEVNAVKISKMDIIFEGTCLGDALVLIALFILVTRLHKKTFLSVITGRKYFDLKRMFFAMSVVAIFSIISLGIQLFSNPSDASVIDFNPPNIDFFIIAIIALILVPIQVSVEEIFFRGHLLQGFSLISKSKFFFCIFR